MGGEREREFATTEQTLNLYLLWPSVVRVNSSVVEIRDLDPRCSIILYLHLHYYCVELIAMNSYASGF